MSSQDPDVIDSRYEVVRRLGAGGFGAVLLVNDKYQRGHLRAMKILRPIHGGGPDFDNRFLNEIAILRELQHPGIPRIYNDGKTAANEIYYTMAFVEGVTLSAVLKKEAPLAPDRIVRLMARMLEILEYAHSKGVVHRDLKPANIMLVNAGSDAEEVKILDFGIAKVMRQSNVDLDLPSLGTMPGMGTPHYMSPEQIRGKDVDARSDLYSLGIILYQMCSGAMPFDGDSELEIATARLTDEPKPLVDERTPDWLKMLVAGLLKRNRDQRPSTKELSDQLERQLAAARAANQTRVVPATATQSDAPVSKVRWRRAMAIAIPIVALTIGGIAWAVFGGAKKPVDPGPPKSDPVVVDKPIDVPVKPTNTMPSAVDSNPGELKIRASDRDRDGTPDASDGCPDDPQKQSKGFCGCGKPETDRDGDGTPDCVDECPDDRNKKLKGICGCGQLDVDTDGDGVLDCKDGCPLNAQKITPGICNCDRLDTDTDLDGTPDCIDDCPKDPNKTKPGLNGCGRPEGETAPATTQQTTAKDPDPIPPPVRPKPARSELVALDWAEIVDADPDPTIVTNNVLFDAIWSTPYPWRIRHRASQIEMCLVPSGIYTRGANADDAEKSQDEIPAHKVKISRAFYISRFEVQEAEWYRISGSTKSAKSEMPIVDVSFVTIAPALKTQGLRLPTEAEWEYACRAGSESPRYRDTLSEIAWFKDNAGKQIHAVGQKRANALGLHDMLGNALELCSDYYDKEFYKRFASVTTPVPDPQGPTQPAPATNDPIRATRGGSFNQSEGSCRASFRSNVRSTETTNKLGMRVVKNP